VVHLRIWAKSTFTLGRSDYQRQYEPILYGWKDGVDHYWCGARDQGDVGSGCLCHALWLSFVFWSDSVAKFSDSGIDRRKTITVHFFHSVEMLRRDPGDVAGPVAVLGRRLHGL
jgi:hypothetical protein